MGKYMRKGKVVGEVVVMEVSQNSFGVRTRARSLALEKDRRLVHSRDGRCKSQETNCNEPRQTSYLALRSRRLEKAVRCAAARDEASQSVGLQKSLSECRPAELSVSEMLDDTSSRLALSEEPRNSLSQLASSAVSHRGRRNLVRSSSHMRPLDASLQSSIKGSASATFLPGHSGPSKGPADASISRSNSVSIPQERSRGILTRNQRRQEKQILTSLEDMEVEDIHAHGEAGPSSNDSRNMEVEACFGENPMDHDARDRRIRETTPNSYIGDMEAPGSATRPPFHSLDQGRSVRALNRDMHSSAPSSKEINDFFAGSELHERRRSIERYNFDPVNDRPLPGRFEWVIMQP